MRPLRGLTTTRERLLRLSPVLMAPIAIAVTCLDFAKHDVSLVKAGIAALMVGAPLAVGATVFLAVLAMRRIDELQRSEERLRSLTELTSDVVWEIDANGRCIRLEGSVERISGWRPDELLGRDFFELIPPACLEWVRLLFAERQASPTPVRGLEITVSHRDGTPRYITVDAMPIVDRQGRLQGFRGVLCDVTESREAMNALRRAQEEAGAANRAKSQFLANMSHELRTPMTAILGFTEILVANLEKPQDVETAAIVHRNAEHLLSLLDDILDLSKIEAGKMRAEPIACSPAAVISDVACLMRRRAEQKGLQLHVESHGPVPETIVTDPGRLRQILLNLVGNAVKFTETGHVRIATRTRQTPGTLPQLEIDVSDTGIGISKEQLANLFMPFTQADASTTRKYGGTGLGLAICKRLAAVLGGEIAVESTPGQGSTFRLSIPLCVAGSVAPAREVPASSASSPVPPCEPTALDCRVLLVEDGPDNQRLIAFLLRKAGAGVTLADDGLAAVEAVVGKWRPPSAGDSAATPFDVILMDIQMPVMDGFEATRRIRSAGHQGPIIALTAHASADDRRRCLDAGFDDYLSKPIDRGELLRLVARHAGPRSRSVPPVAVL